MPSFIEPKKVTLDLNKINATMQLTDLVNQKQQKSYEKKFISCVIYNMRFSRLIKRFGNIVYIYLSF